MPYYNYNPYAPGAMGFGTAGQSSLYGTFQQPMGMTGQQSGIPQQQYMIWVEGEIGAKAFQQPPGVPANMPIPLWDSTDTIVYLKSWNQMGMPNQMQKIHYEMEQQTAGNLTGATGQSNAMSQENQNGTSGGYATKDDLQKMKDEILSAMQGQSKNNGYSGNNRNNGMSNGGGNMNNGKSSV